MCWEIPSKCKTTRLLGDIMLYVAIIGWNVMLVTQDTKVDLGTKDKLKRLKLAVIDCKFVDITKMK